MLGPLLAMLRRRGDLGFQVKNRLRRSEDEDLSAKVAVVGSGLHMPIVQERLAIRTGP